MYNSRPGHREGERDRLWLLAFHPEQSLSHDIQGSALAIDDPDDSSHA